MDKLDIPKAGRYLTAKCWIHTCPGKQILKRPKIISLMQRYKDMENPSASGLYRLFYYHAKYYHKASGLEYLQSAIETDPYNYFFIRPSSIMNPRMNISKQENPISRIPMDF